MTTIENDPYARTTWYAGVYKEDDIDTEYEFSIVVNSNENDNSGNITRDTISWIIALNDIEKADNEIIEEFNKIYQL